MSIEAHEVLYQTKSSKKSKQAVVMDKVYHGSDGFSSIVDKMINGHGIFAAMFEKMDLENNREGNEYRKQGYMLELKPLFSLNSGARYAVHDPGFTREDLVNVKSSGKDTRVTGRNIEERSLAVCQNYRFCLKYYTEYVGGSAGGKMPSGTGIEEMALFVRKKMYVHLNGGKGGKNGKKSSTKEINEDDMPDNYIFHGYFTFVLLGPAGLAEKTFSCLTADGTDCDKKGKM